MIKKYRKKPIIIEAIRLEKSKRSFEEAYVFIGKNVDFTMAQDGPFINIKTSEGTMQANIGDYIIKGINGEVYPCKPDIFEKTYDIFDRSKVKDKVEIYGKDCIVLENGSEYYKCPKCKEIEICVNHIFCPMCGVKLEIYVGEVIKIR